MAGRKDTAGQAAPYLAPLRTLGALYPFLQSIPLLLLHSTCERLAGEWLIIIIIFFHCLICFISLLNALLLTASAVMSNLSLQLATLRIVSSVGP